MIDLISSRSADGFGRKQFDFLAKAHDRCQQRCVFVLIFSKALGSARLSDAKFVVDSIEAIADVASLTFQRNR